MGADKNNYTFTIKDVIDTFGLSRTSLLYYEKLGIVAPVRTEGGGYRTYTENDIFRLMSASFMKGVGIPPKDMGPRLDAGPYSDTNYRDFMDLAEQRIEYDCAVRDCLRLLGTLREKVGAIEVRSIDPYYICYDKAEQGYHHFPASKNLDLLMEHMPLGSLGSVGDDAYVADVVSLRWGRTVPVRYAHLIPGLDTEMDVIGGCRCVVFYHFEQDLYTMTRPQSSAEKDRDRIRTFMEDNQLIPTGAPAFWPCTLPSAQGFFVPTCIPVMGAKERKTFSK